MKKRFLSVLLLLLMLACVFALSACSDKHEHTFTSYVSDNNATCTQDGTETAKCDGCDATDTRTAAGSAGHKLGAWVEEAPATCTAEGVLGHYTCSACNKNFDKDNKELASLAIAKSAHSFSAATCQAPKTCTVCQATDGTALGHAWVNASCTEAKHCSRCSATEGAALGHSWTEATCTAPKTCSVCLITEGNLAEHSWVEATCTKEKHCSVCLVTEGIKLSHTWVEATCTEPRHCSVCQVTEGTTINHTWQNATCTAPKTCSVCLTTEGEPLSHIWQNATCTAAKYCSECNLTDGEPRGHAGGNATCEDKAICVRCSQPYGELAAHSWVEASCTAARHCSVCLITDGEPLQHNYVNYTSNNDATCTEDGTKTGTCSACGKEDTVTEPDTAGHKYGTWVERVEPNCTQTGTHGYYPCTVCGKKFDTEHVEIPNIVIPIKHNEVIDSEVPATCTDTGLSEGKHCADCGATLVEQIVTPKTGHSEVTDAAVPPTCTVSGLKEGKHCSVCNEVIVAQLYDAPTGHSEHEEVTVPATCNSAGTKKITCSKCDMVREEAVPKLTHIPGAAATCTADQTCTLCGAVLTEKRGHSYGTTVTAPTCEEKGYTTYKCSRCDDKYEADYTNALGHRISDETFLEQTPAVQNGANCEITRTYTVECPHCHKSVSKDFKSVEHKYVKSVKTPATCKADGTMTYTCSECSHSYDEAYSDAEAHNWVSEGTGVVTKTCSHCNEQKTAFVSSGNSGTVSQDALQNTDEMNFNDTLLTMDGDVKDQLKDGGNTQISVAPLGDDAKEDALKNSGLTPDQIANIGTVYDFSIENDKGVISEFDGYITIKLPYTLQSGDDVNNIAVYYIDDEGKLKAFPATYADGYITFQTNHFSKYVPTKLTPEERCEKFGHAEEIQSKPATCTEDGYKITVCTRCGKELSKDIIPALPHDYQVTENVAAGCITHGHKVYTCSCGDSYTEKLAATGHSYSETESQPASCESFGYTKYGCSKCDSEYTEYTAQLEHSFEEEVVAPTCTTYGYVKNTCQSCGAVHTTITPATGHSFDEESVTAPTCTKQGYTTYKCSSCDKTQKSDFVPATGHDYEIASVVEATCISQGYTVYECAHCHNTYRDSLVAVVGHSYTDTVIAPTCVTEGYTSRVCDVCGHTTTADITAPTGHSYGETVTAPTCTTGGYTTYKCSECEHSYIGNRTSALGHEYGRAVTAPTCEAGGYTTVTCSRCSNSYVENETAALGHDYITEVIAPTCVAGGYTEYICGRCQDYYTDSETEALGHTWIDATCTEAKHCFVCDATEGEALGHTWADATCTKAEYCTVCNITRGEALGHSWVDATCTEAKHCEHCDITDGQPLGHEWAAATCTTPKTCTVCSVTEGEALGHTWAAATCTAPKTCTVCSATEGTALEHNYQNGVCTECGKSDGTGGADCDHELTVREYVDLAEHGVCGGYFYILKCECGENVTVDTEDGDTSACSLASTLPEMGVDGEGNQYMVMDQACTVCGTHFYTKMTQYVNGCNERMAGSMKITLRDGTVLVECLIDEEYESHNNMTQQRLELESVGVSCGGYISHTVCTDCGKITGFDTVNLGCSESELELVSYDTNVSDAMMDDMSLLEIGVVYYMNIVQRHSDCGLVISKYMTVLRTSECESEQTERLKLELNGTVIFDAEENYYFDEHDYESEYSFEGEGEPNCENGVTIKRTCSICGDSYSYTTYNHNSSVSENVTLPQCPNVSINYHGCPCGRDSHTNMGHSCSATTTSETTYTDNEGNVHSVIVLLYSCGISETRDGYTVSDGCNVTVYMSYELTYDGAVIYQSGSVSNMQMHDFEYEYTFFDEIDCEAGYNAVGTCKNCGHTVEKNNMYGHQEERELIELEGSCKGTRIEIYSCACGKRGSVNVNLGCDTNYQSQTVTDENGVEHNIVTMTCSECGLVYTEDAYNAVTEGCSTSVTIKYTVTIDGADVWVYDVRRTEEVHSYKYEYSFHGEINCDAGYDIIRTCTKCGERAIEYNHRGHSIRQKAYYNLSELGVCGGHLNLMSCPCGMEKRIDYYISCASFNTTYETDGEGVVHTITTYNCTSCGVSFVIDSYTEADTGRAVKVYILTVDGTEYLRESMYVQSTGEECEHNLVETEVEATCTTDGFYGHRCTECDFVSIKETYPAKGHSFNTETGVCDNCGMSNGGGENPPACEHDYEVRTIAPTCTEAGFAEYRCTICGDGYSEQIEALGHRFDTSTGICAICGANGGGENPPACEHALYIVYDSEPETCENGWSGVLYCLYCDYAEALSGSAHDMVCVEIYEEFELTCGAVVNIFSCACGEFQSVSFGANCVLTETQRVETVDGVEYLLRNYSCDVCGLTLAFKNRYVATDTACQYHSYMTCEILINNATATSFNTHNYEMFHSFENGVCTECGEAETSCDHELTVREYVDLAEHGVCGGYFYILRCECGENVTVDTDDGDTSACSLASTEPEMGVDENDNRYMLMDTTCTVCGTPFYTTMTQYVDGCNERMAGSMKITLRAGTVLVECPVDEEYESHNNTVHQRLELESVGVSCGGYIYHTVCTDCGEIIGFDMWSFGCPESELETVSYDTNVSDAMMEDMSLMEIGVKYYLNMVQRHPGCGLVISQYMTVERLSACETVQTIRMVLELNGTVIFDAEEEYREAEHDYDIECTFDGEGEPNCENGVTIKRTCSICGDSYTSSMSNHNPVIYEETKFPQCANITVQYSSCPCGKEAHTSIIHNGCSATSSTDSSYTYTDEQGNVHRVDIMTYSCGVVEKRDYYTIYNGCDGISYISVELSSATGEVIYSGNTVNSVQNHDFEYEYTFLGEVDCDAGYNAIGTCTECGEIIEQNNMRGHRDEGELVEIEGICDGAKIEIRSCPCGKLDNVHVNIMCREFEIINETTVDGNGVTHNIMTRTCAACGLIYREDVYNSVTEGCYLTETVKYSAVIDGVTVWEHEAPRTSSYHDFSAEYIFRGEHDCDAGYDVIRTCKKCGESHTEYGYYGHSLQVNTYYNLLDLGTCGGHVNVMSCVCGKEKHVDYYIIGGMSSTENQTDEVGTEHSITTHTCTECGISFTVDSYTDPATGYQTTRYILTIDSELIVDETVVSTAVDSDSCKHELVETRVEATCTTEGFYGHVCNRCGFTSVKERYPATGHSFNAETGACEFCGMSGEGSGNAGENSNAPSVDFGDFTTNDALNGVA